MLILTRKFNERIFIGDGVIVTVVEIHPRWGKVRLGIEAPEHVTVDREELHRRKERGEP